MRDGQARLHTELVGLARLALSDALNFRRVQRVRLALVLGLLGADALGALQPRCQLRAGRLGHRAQLARDLAEEHPEDRALAAQHGAHALELLGMAVPGGTAAQHFALALVGHLQRDARAFGQAHELLSRDLQQPRVHGVRDCLLLHGGVHDHALELGSLHRLDGRRRLDRGLEQLLHAGFAQDLAKAADLRGVARQLGGVVRHAAEELPHDVLASALHERLVALVEGVLEVQQRDHEPDGQAWAAFVAIRACGSSHVRLTAASGSTSRSPSAGAGPPPR